MPRPVLERLAPAYVPVWEGVFEAWARAWVQKNGWRVRNVLPTNDDAVQECALVWSKCAARYTGEVNNAAWFMSLFKTSVRNHWNTLSVCDTESPERYLEVPTDEEADDRDSRFNNVAELPVGLLAAQWHNASAELKQVFFLLATAPAEVMDIAFAEGEDETINRRLCRWLGFTAGTNVVAEIRAFLSA